MLESISSRALDEILSQPLRHAESCDVIHKATDEKVIRREESIEFLSDRVIMPLEEDDLRTLSRGEIRTEDFEFTALDVELHEITLRKDVR